MNPVFSLVIANHNTASYLKEAFKSVFSQSFTSWEIVFVDDGSTDDSRLIVDELARSDSRIRVFLLKRNRGVGYAKNFGIAQCQGEIIGFLDADDALTPNALEVMVDAHRKFPDSSLIYSTNQLCDSNLSPKSINEAIKPIPEGESYLTGKFKNFFMISHFATFKRTYYGKVEPIDRRLLKAIDQDLYLKLEEVGQVKYINESLYNVRIHTTNISRGSFGWEAFAWEMRAKESAYRRRLHTTIPNLSREELNGQHHYVLQQWALESLKYKRYKNYFRAIRLHLLKLGSSLGTIKFVYYTLRRNRLGDAF